MIFLRANEDSILKALYEQSTIEGIKSQLASLQPDAYHTDRFYELANVTLDGSGDFNEYPPGGGGYKFPTPDKSGLPDVSTMTPTEKSIAWREVVNKAFVPLTEDPVIYSKIKLGFQTENKEPVIRNEQGKLLENGDPNYYPYPMIRKEQDGSGDWFVRFTDYSLDGASSNDYFYFTREISLNYELGPVSTINGPIQLINSLPPQKPDINSVNTLLADPAQSLPPRVQFNISGYPLNEDITKVRIYRTYEPLQACRIGLMNMGVEVPFATTFEDNFSDLTEYPYGETIYYNIVALREIINELGNPELVPSFPSEVVEVRLPDNINPDAPNLSINGVSGATTIDNVELSWNKTAISGTYYVYKMTEAGTWEKIYEVESNNSTFNVPLANTSVGSNQLPRVDNAGNTLYHHFKIDVENSSGLMNLGEDIATI